MKNRRISWYDNEGNIKFVQSCEEGLEDISRPEQGLNFIVGEPEILTGAKVIDNKIVNGSFNDLTTLQHLRLIRDSMLKNSDWTIGIDSPLTDDQKSKWIKYRQELRDLPAKYKDTDNISDISYPRQPK
tara:strand:- start:384 stop:770 length:387 start_codon:yes stop_codon:yes gene_type:complete